MTWDHTRLLTDEELDAIDRRCADATPGRWAPVVYDDLDHAIREGMFLWARNDPNSNRPALFNGSVGTVVILAVDGEKPELKELPGLIEVSGPDARFIAHARVDLPALLAEVRRLRTALAAEPNQQP